MWTTGAIVVGTFALVLTLGTGAQAGPIHRREHRQVRRIAQVVRSGGLCGR